MSGSGSFGDDFIGFSADEPATAVALVSSIMRCAYTSDDFIGFGVNNTAGFIDKPSTIENGNPATANMSTISSCLSTKPTLAHYVAPWAMGRSYKPRSNAMHALHNEICDFCIVCDLINTITYAPVRQAHTFGIPAFCLTLQQ